MRVSLAFFVLSFLIIYGKFKEILTYSQITQFNGNTLGGYTCPVNFIVFELEKSVSDIHCARVCHSYSNCLGVFYQPETLVCVGCSTQNEAELVSTPPSLSLYYERSETRTCSKYSCYLFVPARKTWDAAKNNCALLGGVLVDILSQEEQDFISSHFPANANDIWIGGTDNENEGVFIWLDGSSVEYENWKPDEPNNAGDGENCIIIRNNKWNDAPCNRLYSSICEFK